MRYSTVIQYGARILALSYLSLLCIIVILYLCPTFTVDRIIYLFIDAWQIQDRCYLLMKLFHKTHLHSDM